MSKTKKVKTWFGLGMASKFLIAMGFAFMLLAVPATVYADNTAGYNQQFSNPNWQSMYYGDDWNWLYNWAYQAPEYQFDTTFSYDQWGRPTTSNVAPDHTQNVRRDRHAAAMPPSHGTVSGFYSGEFPTGQVNPYAPTYYNNPNESRAVGIESSPFALLPGESGVNVWADGSQNGGFLASTSVNQNSGGNASNNGSGFTVTHSPINPNQQQSQNRRITTVTPYSDGTIGYITIPALSNRAVAIRPGVTASTLNNFVGHFSYTSQWDGNVALASHNRGQGNFFAGIWNLQRGDRIIYETTAGVRVYEVVSVRQIHETDLENLDYSYDNMLTLITCVLDRAELRWSVRAREI